MQNLSASDRSSIINKLADSLIENSVKIIEANNLDMELAKKRGNNK